MSLVYCYASMKLNISIKKNNLTITNVCLFFFLPTLSQDATGQDPS